MKRNIKLILPLLALLLLSSVAFADISILTIRVIPIKTSVLSGETAYYTLEIINSMNTNEDFLIKTPELEWTLDTIPENNYFFTVYRDSVKRINISVTPRGKLNLGFYRPVLNVERFKTGDITRLGLDINIKSGKSMEFLPSLRATLQIPYEIDSRNEMKFSVDMENLNPRDLQNVSLEIKSKFFTIQRTVNIFGNERKKEEFSAVLDSIKDVGKDTAKLEASVVIGNRTFVFESVADFKIIDYASLDQQTRIESSFLKTNYIIDATNNGNVNREFELRQPMGFFRGLFTSTDPKSDTLKTNEANYMLWRFELDPKEKKTIIMMTNFRPLGIFVLLVLIVFALYYALRPPILVKKSIAQIHTTKEGGISEMKVVLHVKSRSRKIVDSIKIIEKIPFIVEINKEFHVGTLKPTTISKATEEGSIVRWDITNLDPFEERIITYRIKTKLSILGGIKLPATVVKYRNRKNNEVKTTSNVVNLEI
jgi:hypothetical protein